MSHNVVYFIFPESGCFLKSDVIHKCDTVYICLLRPSSKSSVCPLLAWNIDDVPSYWCGREGTEDIPARIWKHHIADKE